MSLHLGNMVTSRLGPEAMTRISPRFCGVDGERVLVACCERSLKPVYVRDGNADRFYIRMSVFTTRLTTKETVQYVRDRFGQ